MPVFLTKINDRSYVAKSHSGLKLSLTVGAITGAISFALMFAVVAYRPGPF